MSLKELMDTLKVEKYPKEYFEEIYEASQKEYEEKGLLIVDEEYLKDLNNKFNLFEIFFKDILACAAMVRKNPNVLRFLYLLKHGMSDSGKLIHMLENLTLPVFENDLLELSPMFSLLPFIEGTVLEMQRRNVPEDIIYDTLKGYENTLIITKNVYNKPVTNMRYLGWLRIFIHGEVLRIGRFNFQIRYLFDPNEIVFANKNQEYAILINNVKVHRTGNFLGSGGFDDEEGSFFADLVETEDYFEGYKVGANGLTENTKTRLYKKEWEKALENNDAIINVHIPEDSQGLEPKLCEESYARAREVFTKCYPEFKYKAFTCFSWLMDPQLKEILNSTSKIISFQEKYMRFPRVSLGNEMFYFIFRKEFENYNEMSENTSLERALKKHYLNGKKIYSFGGVFF